jgi:TolB-like protein/DNA-binding SARP family transcriptional activator
MSFSLRFLGGATIEGPEGPLTGRAAQRHRLALLALLAATPGGLNRDKVIAYLWPESPDDRARRLLSDSLYRIQKALGEGAVQAAGEELRLDPDAVPSDVAAFMTARGQGDWQRAVDAYAGPFLDGFHLANAAPFADWADGERRRFAQDHLDALEALAEAHTEAGDRAAAVACWRRCAAQDPYNSRIAVRLMEAYEAAGNRAGALRHARIHEQLLEQEFGTAPAPEVLSLTTRLRDASSDSAAVAEQDGRPTDRPEPSSSPGPSESTGPLGPIRPAPTAPRRPLRRLRWSAVIVVLVVGAGLSWVIRSATVPAATGPPSVAVLPFTNLSDDDESLYFADGITEDILTDLSRLLGLRVVARSSVMPYRNATRPLDEIARELGVTHVLQGSVRRSDDAVRIAVQLVDVEQEANIWAQSYDRPLEDIFAVQSDIARRVAGALHTRLTSGAAARLDRVPTDDVIAYNFYLRGRYFWHRRTQADLAEAAGFFQRAVERDSAYAQAWAGLADAYAVQAFYDYRAPAEAYAEAKRAALRALALDETLAEAHASLGYVTLYYDWDASGAETAFRRAIELDPSYSIGHQWYGNHLVATGRFDEAARAMGRAREVNPLSLIANGALGFALYYAGRHRDAVAQMDLALEMEPDWDLGHLWRGQALDAMGRSDEAIATLSRAVELSGGSGITVAALAHTYAAAGATDDARALLADLIEDRSEGRYRPSFEIAKVYVALGDHDEALRWLERAYGEHSHSMVFLEVDPQLAPLRQDPSFRRLVERVGLQS